MNTTRLKSIKKRIGRTVMVEDLKPGSAVGGVWAHRGVPSARIGGFWRQPPAIRFGGEEIPPGGWRGGEEIPPGGWRISRESELAHAVRTGERVPPVAMSDAYRTLDGQEYFSFHFESSTEGIRVKLLHYPDVLDEVLNESSSHPWSASARAGLHTAYRDLTEARRAAAAWAETLWAGLPLLRMENGHESDSGHVPNA
jgi:hypothetical protein